MKNIITIVGLLVIGVLCWQFTETISSDAMSMALGLVLGVMAGIPAALMVLASQRRDADDYTRPRQWPQERPQAPHRIEYHTHNHLHVGQARNDPVRILEEKTR